MARFVAHRPNHTSETWTDARQWLPPRKPLGRRRSIGNAEQPYRRPSILNPLLDPGGPETQTQAIDAKTFVPPIFLCETEMGCDLAIALLKQRDFKRESEKLALAYYTALDGAHCAYRLQ